MLLALGSAGIAASALADGRAGLKARVSCMKHWRGAARWYAVALAITPLLDDALVYAVLAIQPWAGVAMLTAGQRRDLRVLQPQAGQFYRTSQPTSSLAR
jgi:hypothetical protein